MVVIIGIVGFVAGKLDGDGVKAYSESGNVSDNQGSISGMLES
jgi:hypothetical protein